MIGSTSEQKQNKEQELKELFENARKEKNENSDGKKAAEYYSKIFAKDPTSYEACFYSVFCKENELDSSEAGFSCFYVNECVGKTIRLLKEDASLDREAKIAAIREISGCCDSFSTRVYQDRRNALKTVWSKDTKVQSLIDECCAAVKILYTLADSLDEHFGDYEELRDFIVLTWKQAIDRHEDLYRSLKFSFSSTDNYDDYTEKTLKTYICKVQKYLPDYRKDETESGCYVATAVYGSYDCPQVWTLRRYRDYTLAKTWYGRAFIHTYYAVSPTLVKWFGDTEWFRRMWKGKLDRMVAKLQSKGVESTPYEDRIW